MNMIVPIQQQFNKFWEHQNNTRRITLIALIVAAAILITLLVTWANTPTYVVAFSGLSETDSASIVQKLTDAKISYQLRDTTTILVPANQVYAVRLQMASSGLPSDGTVGFEIFSGNTLGMTDFTEKINYQRALAGELERTIDSLAPVESSRVSIVTPDKTLLSSDQSPTTASITITEKPGQTLTSDQVQAITHLTASSVENLKPENVVVVDSKGNMLASGTMDGVSASSTAQNGNQRAAEMAAAVEVQQKIQTLLDSVLGPNKSVVKATVNLDWNQREITSQTYNPTPAAIRSSQKTNEEYTTNGSVTGGVPGAGSNLPTPVPTLIAGATGPTSYKKTDETINYEISQVQDKQVVAPGSIKRLSLSVLVDGVTDQTQLDKIKTIVGAAAGIDTTRGDQLAVDTIAFDKTTATQQATDLAKAQQTDLYVKIGEMAAGVILLGLLLWYVLRLFKNLRLATSEAWTPVMKPVGEMELSSPMQMPQFMSGDMSSVPMPSLSSSQQSMPSIPMPEPPPMPAFTHPEDEARQKSLIQMAEENPASVAEIIQIWLSEDEKKHG